MMILDSGLLFWATHL